MGTPSFSLTAQIADTIRAHGMSWAVWHYCVNRRGPKLNPWEARILFRGALAAL